jgi:asparagine synthetase B (glutamine-hydrolysing)
MCGIFFTTTNSEIKEEAKDVVVDHVLSRIKNRGPDFQNVVTINECLFIHTLLAFTGEFTPQPVHTEDKNICVIFNGEIYNYDDFGEEEASYNSDSYAILGEYLKHGVKCFSKFNGEYACVIVDFKLDLLFAVTDTFNTKPLFGATKEENGGLLSFSSYKSALTKLYHEKDIFRLKPNTAYVYSLETKKLLEKRTIFNFDFKNQHKKTYQDWIKAFDKAVYDRVKHLKTTPFVCLSSGYDSGSICNALNLSKVKYETFTIVGKENMNIIEKRFKENCEKSCINTSVYRFEDIDYARHKALLKNQIYENDWIKLCNQYPNGFYNFTDDEACVGLSHIYEIASSPSKGLRIVLSSQGADEIVSDYGFNGQKIYHHSGFGGKFPEDLSTIIHNDVKDTDSFVWQSFFYGTNQAYMTKEEYVGGFYGIEARYPFLDKNVVQEFLWLDVSFKNKTYKSAIGEYLKFYDYPFKIEKK